VANLRHGYYSKSADVVLAELGEDPAEFKRRLDSLVAAYNPVDALQMSLVMQMARALWRIERFHRVAESLAVKNWQAARTQNTELRTLKKVPLMNKIDRLRALFEAVCSPPDVEVGGAEITLLEKCQQDLLPENKREILGLMLRLRKPGTPSGLAPAGGAVADLSAAEGEERRKVRLDLYQLLMSVIDPLEQQFISGRDEMEEWIERDHALAAAESDAKLLRRGEEASLREVWRIAKLLISIRRTRNAKMSKIKVDPD
jgi:hypothetical protein